MSAAVTRTQLSQDLVRLARAGIWSDFEPQCIAWHEAGQRCSDSMLLLAVAAHQRQDYAAALDYATQAAELPDASREAAEFLALLQILVGDLNGSLFSIKLAEALPTSPVRDLLPSTLPNLAERFLDIQNQPLIAQAISAFQAQDLIEAEHWFRQQIEVDGRSEPGYLGLAYCLALQERFRESAEVLRSGLHILPDSAAIFSQLGTALTALGDFGLGRACHAMATERVGNDAKLHAQAIIDQLQDPLANPAVLAQECRRWGETFGEKDDPWMPRPRALAKARLTVGYLLSGLPRRSHARMLADILAQHKEAEFRVVGFGDGALSEAANAPFQRAVSVWQNIRDCDPFTLSAMVAAEDIDILVDASGFSAPASLAALGLRMAPVQLSWLGSPYGAGLAGVDALLGDAFLDPDGDPATHLAHGAMVTALPQKLASVAHEGLVLAADATFAEMCPRTVAAWSAILHRLPAATLVLRDHDFGNQANASRLVELFGTFGVSHRIDVQSGTQSFFAAADICLLPYQTLRGEVVAEALAAGVPPVGWLNEGRHRREALSLLHYLGLAADTLVSGDRDYVALVLDWAGDASRRAGFGDRIDWAHPVLSPATRAADLERVYRDMWQKALANAG